jgi:undecaprenyl diphosphate synthase
MIPRHVALIPDGNRRWAKSKDLPAWEGHRKGIEVFENFLDWCYEEGVIEITTYSLSRENIEKRNQEEIKQLFKLYEINLEVLLDSEKVDNWEARVRFAGDISVFPKNIRSLIAEIEEKSSAYTKRKLTFCSNYSGRGELINAVNDILSSGKTGIDEKGFKEFLQIQSEPDLLIRTAEHRISNFLLWQLAYSEIYFSDKLFPDFTKKDLLDAFSFYNKTKRSFGK